MFTLNIQIQQNIGFFFYNGELIFYNPAEVFMNNNLKKKKKRCMNIFETEDRVQPTPTPSI